MNNEHQMYYGKIDVTKILKEHLFAGKGGQKYLDFVMIPTPTSGYGDSHMVCQSLPKELRDQGKRGPILGNTKPAQKSGGARPAQTRKPEPTERQLANQDGPDDRDSCPF